MRSQSQHPSFAPSFADMSQIHLLSTEPQYHGALAPRQASPQVVLLAVSTTLAALAGIVFVTATPGDAAQGTWASTSTRPLTTPVAVQQRSRAAPSAAGRPLPSYSSRLGAEKAESEPWGNDPIGWVGRQFAGWGDDPIGWLGLTVAGAIAGALGWKASSSSPKTAPKDEAWGADPVGWLEGAVVGGVAGAFGAKPQTVAPQPKPVAEPESCEESVPAGVGAGEFYLQSCAQCMRDGPSAPAVYQGWRGEPYAAMDCGEDSFVVTPRVLAVADGVGMFFQQFPPLHPRLLTWKQEARG